MNKEKTITEEDKFQRELNYKLYGKYMTDEELRKLNNKVKDK